MRGGANSTADRCCLSATAYEQRLAISVKRKRRRTRRRSMKPQQVIITSTQAEVYDKNGQRLSGQSISEVLSVQKDGLGDINDPNNAWGIARAICRGLMLPAPQDVHHQGDKIEVELP